MTARLEFKAEDTIVERVLFSEYKKYKVPRYQRPYAWTEEQLSEFWNDLINNDQPYFIGSFIFNHESSHKTGWIEIIDGQQRLLTITIFASALRDIAKPIDSQKAKLYHTKDIIQQDRYGKASIRIVPGDSIKDYFKATIQDCDNNILDTSPDTKEQSRIRDAYKYFHSKLTDDLTQFDSNDRKLARLDCLRKRVSNLIVIDIKIMNEEEAYEIFETTNARGIDLSVADLLKNLIFKKIPAQQDRDLAKEIWQDVTNNIEETNTELKKFVRYFWLSRYASVSEKKLFREIKKRTTNWDTLLDEIWNASACYNKLLQGNAADFQDLKNGHKIYKALFSIRLMNVSQCYVVFLSILRNFKSLGTDPTKVFQLIENFTFKYSVVCKLPGNKVENIYSKYALKVQAAASSLPSKKRPAQIQKIFADLQKELTRESPSRDLFCDKFANISYKNSEQARKLIKYILGKMNDHSAATQEQKINFDNVNIEHILPQKPHKDWHLTKKEIKPYVNKLGNLTLVGKQINSKLQNKVIKHKMPELKRSELPVTKILVNHLNNLNNKWGEPEITTRQKALAELAFDKVWA